MENVAQCQRATVNQLFSLLVSVKIFQTMRICPTVVLCLLILAMPASAMDQQWIDDLNQRFPGIGNEFEMAVRQKLSPYGETADPQEIITTLLADPDYVPDRIANARSFSAHSELMLLYPAIGEYEKSLKEAKLLRDFILRHSPEDERILQTFRGVYSELLLVNGQYEEALKEIEQTIAIDPSEAGNYLSQGVAYVRLQRLEDALDSLKILVQHPDGLKYAQQLFVFIMEHRRVFQGAQLQKNTMIDVMLKEIDSESSAATHLLTEVSNAPDNRQKAEHQPPASSSVPTASTPTPSKSEKSSRPAAAAPSLRSLTALKGLNAEQVSKLLGPPLMESEGATTFDRDYPFRGETLNISFDKKTRQSVSFQMFFLPPVDQNRAFAQIGLKEEAGAVPVIDNDMLKVWGSYGPFSKLRLSLSEGRVIAVIVEP